MRVLQVIAGAEYGGAEAFFTRMVLALNKAGLEQQAVIKSHPQRAEILARNGIKVSQLPFKGVIDIYTPLALKRDIRSFAPDIVLTWMSRASRTCPKGDFIHVARLGGYFDPKYYRNCDHLIGNTLDIVEYLRNSGWPEERTHYLPNFVNGERAPPAPRRDSYIPDKAPLLLALGRLHEDKAFDVLMKAMTRLPDAYLWLAGDGPLRQELESQAESLGVKHRVRFLGWRDDVAALLAACDVFICPSRHEPLGNVVIEAWAHSAPVVAADSLGPGVLIKHMETGLLAPVDDPISLAEAVNYLLGDSEMCSRLVKEGLAAYESEFTESMVVEKYLDFFNTIVN